MGIIIAIVFLGALVLGLSLAAVCLGLLRPRFCLAFWAVLGGGSAFCLWLAFQLMARVHGTDAFLPWLLIAACAGLSPALMALAACRLFPRRTEGARR